ncbi:MULTISPECIES: hypothetical protein [unclassified Allomuricauda]|uniref:hypothetical protein n=1 Tax=unclassified Allomuricauda TaxID=2615049 RepID=UPI00273E68BD|nr:MULTISPECIES: hypothetical protein [unclassified Allomuricauda]
MASFVWDRDPQEALNHPFEYHAQEQFYREATALTEKLAQKLCDDFQYTRQDRSLEKATWMLQTDCLHAFKDAVLLLKQEKHRVASRLFRDILETVHLIEFLNSDNLSAKKSLSIWYDDQLIMHREYRKYIEKNYGQEQSELAKTYHRIFSKFTHRSYKILLYGYILGSEDRIIYDEKWKLKQTISMYYAYLGHFGRLMVKNLKNFGNLSPTQVESIWEESMEAKQNPRGYLSDEDLKFLGIEEE